ncbi:hypothetical protein LCGC14_2727990 [marine sediment metagenome]|uniref:Uncharacterized protein n=1 Tax=marine sediment metagenome TaxID=412755 RepID=A0A0F8ZVJ6_9ZZZZ
MARPIFVPNHSLSQNLQKLELELAVLKQDCHDQDMKIRDLTSDLKHWRELTRTVQQELFETRRKSE